MRKQLGLAILMVAFSAVSALGDPATAPAMAAAPPATAPSRVVAVTVYQGTALVTREVDVRDGLGLQELVVSPLPPQIVDSSLYSEASDGIRVLSTRFRTRAVQQDTRKEVRELEETIKKLNEEQQRIEKDIQTSEENIKFLGRLENFTSATMAQLQEKGMLNAEATISLSKFIIETRAKTTTALVLLQQQAAKNTETLQFTQRKLGEVSAGASHTETDAVITIDKANAAPGKVKLNYLVNSATWTPQYKLRAAGEKDPIQLEYLGAVEQQSGEDWHDVEIVLSTAQPMLNAAPPDLLAINIAVGGPRRGGGGGGGAVATTQPLLGRGNNDYSGYLRNRAQQEFNTNNPGQAKNFINDAAALEQTQELLSAPTDQPAEEELAAQQPSVSYHLKARQTVPSRNDQQLIELARIDKEFIPTYFYKAIPVLTNHVYRLAILTNKSDYVLLPGVATMYSGSDFVGRMNMPLVAIGQQFTIGLGIDPQMQVDRTMLNKSNAVQGGNQVHTFTYRIRVSSFKTTPVQVQVWDRVPKAENNESVGITLVETKPALSTDPTYVRADRPNNLLRWDLTVDPGTNGEKAVAIEYQFKLEYARDVSIGNFQPKR